MKMHVTLLKAAREANKTKVPVQVWWDPTLKELKNSNFVKRHCILEKYKLLLRCIV